MPPACQHQHAWHTCCAAKLWSFPRPKKLALGRTRSFIGVRDRVRFTSNSDPTSGHRAKSSWCQISDFPHSLIARNPIVPTLLHIVALRSPKFRRIYRGATLMELMRNASEKDKLISGEGCEGSTLDVRFQPSCREITARQGRRQANNSAIQFRHQGLLCPRGSRDGSMPATRD